MRFVGLTRNCKEIAKGSTAADTRGMAVATLDTTAGKQAITLTVLTDIIHIIRTATILAMGTIRMDMTPTDIILMDTARVVAGVAAVASVATLLLTALWGSSIGDAAEKARLLAGAATALLVHATGSDFEH